jgi:predicted ATPase/class 3 adenylate cyclase
MPATSTRSLTFLFTDIEGSTRMWEADHRGMGAALMRHNAVVREAIETHGGYVFKVVGDAFCAAFVSTGDALRSAMAAQRSLDAEPWGDGPVIRVRMALHYGSAEAWSDDFFGLEVNRCQRLLSIGHGGQVLLSQTAYDLLRDALPDSVGCRDLGEHRLKDLSRPEHVFQAVTPDLQSDFPPLCSLDLHAHNLPIELTSFIGRDRELSEVKRLLGTTPLLTLTGVGGSGKTRLALHVAADVLENYADGVWWVDLAPLADSELVPTVMAETLGLREEAGRPLIERLVDHLRPQARLLVLDNCEHVVEVAADLVSTLLARCPHLHVLATSRESLRVSGEAVWPVPMLVLPDLPAQPDLGHAELAGLARADAVQLFVARAQAVVPDFNLNAHNAAPVVEVCRRLDGLALAIELAAARVTVLTAGQILARLDDRFRLLTTGGRSTVPRHQTLRATIDWSQNLLAPREKAVLRRLSVFSGGWTLEAAEVVCTDIVVGTDVHGSGGGGGIESPEVLDLLASLVMKSLVVAKDQSDGVVRYGLLESIRVYAAERLAEAAEAESTQLRHAVWFLQVSERAEETLSGPEQAATLQSLDTEHDNVRAAMHYFLSSGQAELGCRLAAALWRYWYLHGHLTEARTYLAQLLNLKNLMDADPRWRAKAHNAAGALAYYQGDLATAQVNFEAFRSLSRELGEASDLARALNNLANVACDQARYAEAQSLFAESLALHRAAGDDARVAGTLTNMARLAQYLGQLADAQATLEESLVIARRLGLQVGVAGALVQLASLANGMLDFSKAQVLAQEGLEIHTTLDNKVGMAEALQHLAVAAAALGDCAEAMLLIERSLALMRSIEDTFGIATALVNLGYIYHQSGEDTLAEVALLEGLAMSRQANYGLSTVQALLILGDVAQRRGESASARSAYLEVMTLSRAAGNQPSVAQAIEKLMAVAVTEQQAEWAVRMAASAEVLRARANSTRIPREQMEFELQLNAARLGLSTETADQAWRTGQSLTLDEACACALETPCQD